MNYYRRSTLYNNNVGGHERFSDRKFVYYTRILLLLYQRICSPPHPRIVDYLPTTPSTRTYTYTWQNFRNPVMYQTPAAMARGYRPTVEILYGLLRCVSMSVWKYVCVCKYRWDVTDLFPTTYECVSMCVSTSVFRPKADRKEGRTEGRKWPQLYVYTMCVYAYPKRVLHVPIYYYIIRALKYREFPSADGFNMASRYSYTW